MFVRIVVYVLLVAATISAPAFGLPPRWCLAAAVLMAAMAIVMEVRLHDRRVNRDAIRQTDLGQRYLLLKESLRSIEASDEPEKRKRELLRRDQARRHRLIREGRDLGLDLTILDRRRKNGDGRTPQRADSRSTAKAARR